MTKVIRFTTAGLDLLLQSSLDVGYQENELLKYLKFLDPLATGSDAKLINLVPYCPHVEVEGPIVAASFETALKGETITVKDVIALATELRASEKIGPDSQGAEKKVEAAEQLPDVSQFKPSDLDVETAEALASEAEKLEL